MNRRSFFRRLAGIAGLVAGAKVVDHIPDTKSYGGVEIISNPSFNDLTSFTDKQRKTMRRIDMPFNG